MNPKHLFLLSAMIPVLAFAQPPMAMAKTSTHTHKTKVTRTHHVSTKTKKHVVGIVGTIQSIGTDTFTLKSGKRGEYTVTIGNTTKMTDTQKHSITLADLHDGEKVRVNGVIDKKTKSISEVSIVKEIGTNSHQNGIGTQVLTE